MAPTANQQRCIQDTFGIPTAMVAGAGSGKTDTLTRRIAYALLHPEESGVTDVSQILAITYTNKAAGELKARIKQVLEEEATPENGLRDQALKVDSAWIGTIHGMCSRILRENALVFGIDPAFTLVQNEAYDALIKQAIEAVVAQVLNDPSTPEEAELLQEYGRDDLSAFISKIAKQMVGSAEDDALACFVIPEPQDSVELLLNLVLYAQEMIQRIEVRLRGPKSRQPSDTEKTFNNQAQMAVANVLGLKLEEISVPELISATISHERLEELRELDPASLLKMVDCFPWLSGSLRSIKREPLEATGLLPQISFAQAALSACLIASSRFLPLILLLAQQAVKRFTCLKRERGYVDNSDLLALVATKFKNPAFSAISERYANQFKLVMVDEFQDTNQMQVDMINLIAGGSSQELSEKMCVVGDAQQSIYRFNGADVDVFTDYARRVEESPNGSVIELGDNFRSHAEILAFCKGVFEPVFGNNYLDLLHGRDEERASEQAPYYGVVQGEDALVPRRVNVKTFQSIRQRGITKMAAQEIARDFKELVDRGNRPSEMAILLGKMTNASDYAQALQDVGLKCAITGGSVFGESSDVLLVVDLCSALLNPYDTQALANVLTSDLFCLSADDLLVLVSLHEGKKGSLADAFMCDSSGKQDNVLVVDGLPEGSSEALHHAVTVLQHAMRGIGEYSLSDMVSQVLVESGWLYRQQSEGLGRAGNVFKALRILRQIQDESPALGFGIIQQFKNRLAVAKEEPGILSTEGDEFVRIMTIHSSKGLSIPIVAVAETEKGSGYFAGAQLHTYSQKGKTYLVLDPGKSKNNYVHNGLVEMSFGTYKDYYFNEATELDALHDIEIFEKRLHFAHNVASYYEAICLLDDQKNLQERQRLLYVAFTRAKDALIVTHRAPTGASAVQIDGNPTVSGAIMNLVDPQVLEQTESSEIDYGSRIASSVTCLVPLHARYSGAPEYDLEWQLRYQHVTEQDKGSLKDVTDNEREGEAAEAAMSASLCTGAAQEASSVSTASLEVDGTVDVTEAAKVTIKVPVLNQDASRGRLIPYRAQWAEGILSASSLKDARGEHLEGVEDEPIDPVILEATRAVYTQGLNDEGSDEDIVAEPPAAATERGTAFHALGEWAATHRASHEPLSMPPDDRIHAMARLYGLNARQEESLYPALSRWLSSEAARMAVEHTHLQAEQPFWVQLRPAQEGSDPRNSREPLILQGFIDLLCYNQPNQGKAYVVDYKTGTGYNTDAKRRQAYELQAMCYAYALLKQGFSDVQLDFVFVDQPSVEDVSEPVIVRFPAPDSEPWTIEYLQGLILEAL